MTGWQPIETAPKDGTDILAAQVFGSFRVLGCEPIAVLQWHDDLPLTGWVGSTSLGMAMRYPTHWMPLPDLPA